MLVANLLLVSAVASVLNMLRSPDEGSLLGTSSFQNQLGAAGSRAAGAGAGQRRRRHGRCEGGAWAGGGARGGGMCKCIIEI